MRKYVKFIKRIVAVTLSVVMMVSLFQTGLLTTFADEVTETTPVLDFVPEGDIANASAPSVDTATIDGTSINVYKSADYGATGIVIAVEPGTEIKLVTAYTFSNGQVIYRYDYCGDNTELADAALSEYSGYVFVAEKDITIGGDGEEATPTPTPTAEPTPTPTPVATATPTAEPTTSPDVEEEMAGIKDYGSLDFDAYITTESLIIYKSHIDDTDQKVIDDITGEKVQAYFFYELEDGTIKYKVDYAGENIDLTAAIAEGYTFVKSTDVSKIYADSKSGVTVSGDIPEGATLSVAPKTLVETGIDTTIYPVGENSLFYDVTLFDENNSETQPGEGGITVTFPEDKILAAGFAVGDSYHVYHIHDGVVDMTAATVYDGGDIPVHFDNLSEIGIVEAEESIDMSSNPVVTQEDLRDDNGYGVSAILTNEVVIYDGLENASVHTATVTGYEGTEVELIFKITLKDGSVYYQYAYYGADADFNTIAQKYTLVSSSDVTKGISDATTGIIVTGNIPDNVTLVVTPQYFTEFPDYVDTSFFDWHDYIFLGYDISLVDSEGSKWQPADGETVTVTIPNAWNSAWGPYARVDVYHLNDDDATVKETFSTQNDNVTLLEDGGIAFEVGSFSTFVVGSSATETITITTDDGDNHTGTHKGHIIYIAKNGNALVTINGLNGNITDPERLSDTSNGKIVYALEGANCRITAVDASVGDSCIFKWTWTVNGTEYTADVLVVVIDTDSSQYDSYHDQVIHHIQLNVQTVAVVVNGQVVDTLDDVALGYANSTNQTLTKVFDPDSAVGYYYTYSYTVPASGTEGETGYTPSYTTTITIKIDETLAYVDGSGNTVDVSTLDFLISDVTLVSGTTGGEQDQVTFIGTFPAGVYSSSSTDTQVHYLISVETSYYGTNDDFYGDRLSFSTSIAYWDEENVCPGKGNGTSVDNSGGIDVAEFSMGYTYGDTTYYVVYSDLTKIIKGDVLNGASLANATKQYTFTIYRREKSDTETNAWEEFDTIHVTGDFIADVVGGDRASSKVTLMTDAEKYDPVNLNDYEFMIVETGNNIDGYSCTVTYNKTNGIFEFDALTTTTTSYVKTYGSGNQVTKIYMDVTTSADGETTTTTHRVVTTITTTGHDKSVTTYTSLFDANKDHVSTTKTETKKSFGGTETTTSTSDLETHKSKMVSTAKTAVERGDFPTSSYKDSTETTKTIVYNATLSCTNTYEKVKNGLTINKIVNGLGALANEAFVVTITPTSVTLTDGHQYTYYINDNETPNYATVANGVITVTISKDQSLYFDDLPHGTYKIQEMSGSTVGFTYDTTPYTRTITEKVGAAVNITNIYSADATIGSLKVYKEVVTGENADYSKPTEDDRDSFEFEVTIGVSTDIPYTIYESSGISLSTGTMTGGKITIELKDGQYVIFDGIKYDTTYSVTEKETAGYELASSTNVLGNIKAQEMIEARFINTYLKPTADLTISKTVEVPAGFTPSNEKFTFTVTHGSMTALEYTIYNVGDNTPKSTGTISSSGTLQLAHNQYAVIEDMPIGAYAVTETANPNYTTTVPANASGTLTASGATVNFVNTVKKANLDITKDVVTPAGIDKSDVEFTFTVDIENAKSGDKIYYTLDSDTTKTALNVDTNGNLIITLKDGQTAHLVDLPVGAQITVTETQVDGYTTTVGGEVTNSANTPDGGLSSDGFEITFVNTLDVGILTVTKQVSMPTGFTAPANEEFNFVVYVSGVEAGDTLPYTISGVSETANATVQADNGKTYASISLKNGQTATFAGIPAGDVTVTEIPTSVQAEVYTVTSTASGTSPASDTIDATVSTGQTTAVEFTNTAKEGSLTISKTVTAPTNSVYKNREFTFTVYIENAAVGTLSYRVGNDSKITMVGEESKFTITLKDGQIATFVDLPAGADYTVTETEDTDFTTTVAVNNGQAVEKYVANGFISANSTESVSFINARNKADLTIIKKATDGKCFEENETFIFNITGPDGYSTQVVIGLADDKDGEVDTWTEKDITIKNLPLGTYMVTEEVAWSYRYTALSEPSNGEVTLTETADGTVTIINTAITDKWLTSDAYAENIFADSTRQGSNANKDTETN